MLLFMLHRVFSFLTLCCVALLFITGLAKLLDVSSKNEFLDSIDSLLPFMTHKQTMIIAAVFELAVAWRVWSVASLMQRSATLLWFCGIVSVYKVGLHVTYSTVPCSCLGVIGRLFQLSSPQLELTTWMVLVGISASALGGLVSSVGVMSTLSEEGG